MSDPTLRQKVLVTNPQGLHIRPAAKFAAYAQNLQSEVFVCKGDQRANGRHPMELFMLFVPADTELTIEVTGPDAETALPVLVEILNTPVAEDV